MSEPEAARVSTDVVSETPPRRRRRQSSRGESRSSTKQTRGRLRTVYFSLAALWGFIAGTGAILVGLRSTGQPLQLGGGAVWLLGGAVCATLVGGVVVSAGYRSASRRLR